MNAIVIGFGISGQAAAALLLEMGYQVLAFDKNHETLLQLDRVKSLTQNGVALHSELHPIPSDVPFNLAVVSPGIPSTHPLCEKVRNREIPLLSEIELASRFVHRPLLGITGTNGKTTVTMMTAHVLNHLGISSRAMGNSGDSLANAYFSSAPTDTIALELSSYQLDTTHSACLDCAIILNITPDHLDRYGNMSLYAESKMHIFDLVKGDGERWIHEKTYREFSEHLPKMDIKRYGESADCELRRIGNQVFYKEKVAFLLPKLYEEGFRHDVENIMATYALCRRFCKSGDAFVEALATFKKPPHRLEFVRTVEGIDYYNDSKGTNVDAVVRAVEALNRPIVLIAGGVDKKTGYAPWIPAFKDKVKGVCVIGEAAYNINNELSEHYLVKQYGCLRSAVKGATELADKGDVVLLSPGCASMDMFKDYADRGSQFVTIVNTL